MADGKWWTLNMGGIFSMINLIIGAIVAAILAPFLAIQIGLLPFIFVSRKFESK